MDKRETGADFVLGGLLYARLRITNIKEAKETLKMSICVVACSLTGLSEDRRLF